LWIALFRTSAANLQCVMFSGVQKTEFCLDLVFGNRSAVTKIFSRPYLVAYGRTYATGLRPSVICDVMYCG